jgi:hypothetical protein
MHIDDTSQTTTILPSTYAASNPGLWTPTLSGAFDPSVASDSAIIDFSMPEKEKNWRREIIERAQSALSKLDAWGFEWGFEDGYKSDFEKLVERLHQEQEQQEQQERRERNKSRCTRPRPPSKSPLPPAFDLPPPQDLEHLLSQQNRMRRRLRVMESFQMRHLRFGQHAPDQTNPAPHELWNNRILRQTISIKQAWRDGVAAAQGLLSGTLPRELHSVLGAAQLASAIRSTMDDVDSPITSEVTFLSDLSRWKLLLPSDSHAAFDYYADLLWDNRPPPDLAQEVYHDDGTLVYFQDLLVEMLSYVESSPPEQANSEAALPSSDTGSSPPIDATNPPSLPALIHNEAWLGSDDTSDLAVQDKPQHITLAGFALAAAGTIFALILAYLLCKCPSSTIRKLALTPLSSVYRSLPSPNRAPLLRQFRSHHELQPRCGLGSAIEGGPQPHCREVQQPTFPYHDARQNELAAAHCAVLRGDC